MAGGSTVYRQIVFFFVKDIVVHLKWPFDYITISILNSVINSSFDKKIGIGKTSNHPLRCTWSSLELKGLLRPLATRFLTCSLIICLLRNRPGERN